VLTVLTVLTVLSVCTLLLSPPSPSPLLLMRPPLALLRTFFVVPLLLVIPLSFQLLA
jgi:hypothetical protein